MLTVRDTTDATVRPLADADWPHVVALEAATYRDLGLSEGAAKLRGRAGAGTSFVLAAGPKVLGYLLALPCPYGSSPDLTDGAATVPAGPIPAGPADLHLHDLTVAAEHRRTGLGSRLARHLLAAARDRGYRRVSLVALDGRAAFWARHGFRPQPAVPAPAGYGPGATYMSRSL